MMMMVVVVVVVVVEMMVMMTIKMMINNFIGKGPRMITIQTKQSSLTNN
jgi:hypothetical protein